MLAPLDALGAGALAGILAAAVLALLLVALSFLFRGRPYFAWAVPAALALAGWWAFDASTGPSSPWWLSPGWLATTGLFVVLALVFGVPVIRRNLVTRFLAPVVEGMLPRIGGTEREALEAGTTWWDAQLFSGRPEWRTLLDTPRASLTERELEFLDGPVEELCRLLDEWDVMRRGDLPEEAWDLIKREKLWGLIIPEQYGGLGFSDAAHSAVVTKIATRSVTAAVTVMVPNSLGPAELLLEYGTEEERQRYLPGLATGEEIPCFALTGPEAGSDAAATESSGVVCHGEWDGEEVLGIRLAWQKRYITLGPVSTVIGLAFHLRDPDHLLGDEEDIGITVALVPSDLEGIEIGERHDPMGVPFVNGPNRGTDVFVPMDAIVGGAEHAGQGWRMLMESLAAGRSISMPSLAVGLAQLSTRVVSAFAMVREQFDTPIGRFEGIEEPLCEMAGLLYAANAATAVTHGAIQQGAEPAVISGIMKCYLTECMRDVVNHAMDVRAGAAIVRGPRNILAQSFQAVPIGITVEGANILTRSMIIYGQGAIRCHPYVLDEIHALENDDLEGFDRAFFRHVGHPFVMATRSLLLGIFGGWLISVPTKGRRSDFARLSRLSAAFALVSEGAMLSLGGALKKKERITGRLADALAWLYLGSCVLEQHHKDSEQDAEKARRDEPFARWGIEHAVKQIERSLLDVLANLPVPGLGKLLRVLIFPLGVRLRPTDDELVSDVARALLDDPDARDDLTKAVYRPSADEPGLGRLEHALDKARRALDVESKLRQAVRDGKLDRAPGDRLAANALAEGIITQEEREWLHEADDARWEAIQVDSFTEEEYPRLG